MSIEQEPDRRANLGRSDHPTVDFVNDGTQSFAIRRNEAIVRGGLDRAVDLFGDRFDSDAGHPELEIDGQVFMRVVGIDTAEVLDRSRQHPEDCQPNPVLFAQGDHQAETDCCPHWSQRFFQGTADAMTADWNRDGQVPSGAVATGASMMRASPLHMNPLHMNPLHMNPLHMNPLFGFPLHMNPLHMNGYISNAVPVERDRQSTTPEPDPEAGAGVYIHILDSGLGVSGPANEFVNPFLDAHGMVSGDRVDQPDRLSAWNSLAPPDGFVDPVAGHGTFIAGIYAQLLPKAEIHVEAIFDESGITDGWTVAHSIAQLMLSDKPSGVLNLSFGGTLADFTAIEFHLLHLATAWASSKYVIVGSAGNLSSCEPHYPAAFGPVVSVGALDRSGVAWFSNFGDWVQCWAPGVDLISTFLVCDGALKPFWVITTTSKMQGSFSPPWPNSQGYDIVGFGDRDDFTGGWAAWSGTSFAAPLVGAEAARLVGSGMSPTAATDQVRDQFALRESG